MISYSLKEDYQRYGEELDTGNFQVNSYCTRILSNESMNYVLLGGYSNTAL